LPLRKQFIRRAVGLVSTRLSTTNLEPLRNHCVEVAPSLDRFSEALPLSTRIALFSVGSSYLKHRFLPSFLKPRCWILGALTCSLTTFFISRAAFCFPQHSKPLSISLAARGNLSHPSQKQYSSAVNILQPRQPFPSTAAVFQPSGKSNPRLSASIA
jgi:hypothetical protein